MKVYVESYGINNNFFRVIKKLRTLYGIYVFLIVKLLTFLLTERI